MAEEDDALIGDEGIEEEGHGMSQGAVGMQVGVQWGGDWV